MGAVYSQSGIWKFASQNSKGLRTKMQDGGTFRTVFGEKMEGCFFKRTSPKMKRKGYNEKGLPP